MKLGHPRALTNFTEGVNVAIAYIAPVIELDSQLKGRLSLAHKFLLIDIHQAMEIAHRGNRGFTDTHSANGIRFDQGNIQQTRQSG